MNGTYLPHLATHAIPVGDGHLLHVQEFGSADGMPALVVHGGPGSAQTPMLRRGFQSDGWRLICIDQRGCGGSSPKASIHANTTAHLMLDMKQIRITLGIERWLVVGGSWGASLSLAYAATEPAAVSGLILRSSFVARRTDLATFFEGGPFGTDIARVLAHLLHAMTGDDAQLQREAATSWWHWERERLDLPRAANPEGDALDAVIYRYRIQSHYLAHDCWLGEPDLLERARHMPSVPTLLLHGDCDRVCPIDAARELALAMPHAIWLEVPGVGHDPTSPAMMAAMQAATKAFARDGHFDHIERRDLS